MLRRFSSIIVSTVAPLTCCYICCVLYSSSTAASSTTASIPMKSVTFREFLQTASSSSNESDKQFYYHQNEQKSSTKKQLGKENFIFAGFHGTSLKSSLCDVLVMSPPSSDEVSVLFAINKNDYENEKQNSLWSKNNGNAELGSKGLYVSTNLDAALLYGAAQASQTEAEASATKNSQSSENGKVVIFEVYYDASQQWNEPPTVIPSNKTFDRFTSVESAKYENPPHDLLEVQNDGNNFQVRLDTQTNSHSLAALDENDGRMSLNSLLPSQYKINQHRSSDLRFVLKLITQDSEQAFILSEQSMSKNNNNCDAGDGQIRNKKVPLPILKVMPDGNCLFHSLSWHLKMDSEERGLWKKKMFDDNHHKQNDTTLFGGMAASLLSTQKFNRTSRNAYFGSDSDHLRKTMELKKELVLWMIQKNKEELKTKSDPSIPCQKPTLSETWDLLTSFGEDVAFFGNAASFDNYLKSLLQECNLYFSSSPDSYRGTGIFADIQLFYPAIAALYPRRPVILFTDKEIVEFSDEVISKNNNNKKSAMMKPLVFTTFESGKNDSDSECYPVEIVHTWGSLHYDAVSWRGPFSNRNGMHSKL